MVVTTPPFHALTQEAATTLGLNDARIVTVGHPLGGTDEATIEAWADAAVEQTLGLLTT